MCAAATARVSQTTAKDEVTRPEKGFSKDALTAARPTWFQPPSPARPGQRGPARCLHPGWALSRPGYSPWRCRDQTGNREAGTWGLRKVGCLEAAGCQWERRHVGPWFYTLIGSRRHVTERAASLANFRRYIGCEIRKSHLFLPR